PFPGTLVQQPRSRGQHLFLGLVQVRDTEVKMELLRPGRVGPLRRHVVSYLLEGQDESGRRVQGRPAVTQGPSPILLIDSPTKQRLVELGEFRRLGAVQHHTLHVSDHGLILSADREPRPSNPRSQRQALVPRQPPYVPPPAYG